MQIYNIDFSLDLLRCILWQYNDAENLQALIQGEADFFQSQTVEFWRNWYDDVFNLDTANDFGLTVWAIILGLSQKVRLKTLTQGKTWGFNKKDAEGRLINTNNNFERVNFAAQDSMLSVNSQQLRMLLKIRVMQLVGNGSTYDINRMLNKIFPGNMVFCRDNYDMTITYYFNEIPSPDVILLLQRSDVFSPPAGVGYNVSARSANTWGFGPHRMNFHRGNFYHFHIQF